MEKAKTKLTICVLSKSEMCSLTVGCLFNLYSDKKLLGQVELGHSLAVGQSDLPKARSKQCDTWYRSAQKGEVFMFIDADQTFTGDDILKSLSFLETHDVVCGAYSRKNGTMTVEPKNIVSFYRDRQGELFYGSTGFMMMSYDIVDRLAKNLKQHNISKTEISYPFFYERVIDEPDAGKTNLWLGEDYSFCWLVRNNGGVIFGWISDTIGHVIPDEKMVQIPKGKTWSSNSIVYYCPSNAEIWDGNSIKKGIGGSETAVISLSKYWASQGYDVTVLCNCGQEGVIDKVNYKRAEGFNPFDIFNILIIWRHIELLTVFDFQCKKCFLDLHDLVKPELITPSILKNVSKICVKSRFHAGLLGDVRKDKVAVIPNGGFREKGGLEKDPNYLIYASSYDRGLPYMLKWGWPRIKKACPDAYLKLFYGWNVFDKLRKDDEDTKLYKQTVVDLINQDGVIDCGRVSQEELMKEKEKANIHYYIGDFQEIDCISVRESASVGTIPIVSDSVEVFREKDYCLRVEGNPREKEAQEKGADCVISILQNPQKNEEIRNGLQVPEEESWEKIAQRWIKCFDEQVVVSSDDWSKPSNMPFFPFSL